MATLTQTKTAEEQAVPPPIVTTIQEHWGLSEAQMFIIKLEAALVIAIRERRKAMGLTQAAVAERCGLSQSRISGMENHTEEVSLDALLKVLLCLGASSGELAEIVGGVPRE